MTTTQSIRQTGASFNRLGNMSNLKSVPTQSASVGIGSNVAFSAAQAMTLIGYSDCQDHGGVPFRSLDFNVKCNDYADLAACLKIIRSYNEFDSDLIARAAHWILNLKQFMNYDNPNNGCNLFDFNIAREGSPAFYVSWDDRFKTKIISDYEDVEAEGDRPAGTVIFWKEYTEEDFKADMQTLAGTMKADEFSIEERVVFGHKHFTARFWFD